MSAPAERQVGAHETSASTTTGNHEQQLSSSNNKRPLTYTRPSASGARQKRASFGQQRSGSGQSSWSSQTSAGSAARRRTHGREPAPSANENDDDNDERDEANLLPTSNADYERIRNETLLFFLDRLYLASTEGKEARTLHDLSCLFGTRDFTREMRQIVGASRNGLKKFLQSFPSLFHIEGDKVYLTQLKQDTASTARDYNKEAVDYFKQKLLQFGTSLVPIRNLFGYRSQASQEVRHVSGKNARDFKRFLKTNEDVFELLADGEHVMLKSVVDELREQLSKSECGSMASLHLQSLLQADQCQEQEQQEQPRAGSEVATSGSAQRPPEPSRDEVVAMDPYLNKRFAHLIEQCLRKMQEQEPPASQPQFKVTLDELHDRIKLDCQNELFLKMVKTIDELKVFLRMHPKLFRRFTCPSQDGQSEQDCVSLVNDEQGHELDSCLAGASLPYQPQLMARQRSALEAATKSANMAKMVSKDQADKSVLQDADAKAVAPERRPQEAKQAMPRVDAKKPAELLPVANPDETKENSNQKTESAKPTRVETILQEKEAGQGSASKTAKQTLAKSSSQQAQLRANAPPFVPLTRATAHQQQQPVPRSLSNLGPRHGPQMGPHGKVDYNSSFVRRNPMHQPIDQRSAIRDYLTRPSTGPLSNNLQWAAPTPANLTRQQHHHQAVRQPSDLARPLVYGSANFNSQANGQQVITNKQLHQSGEDLRARTVDIVREASNIITRIMNSTDAVAFDCKGYNLGFDGQITLIQFGFLPTKSKDPVAETIDSLTTANAKTTKEHNNNTSRDDTENKSQKRPKPEVCVFDLITNPELAYCLKPLLESHKIIKIVHDVRNKSNALYVQFKIILNNVFDTQVANLVIQQQDTGKPAYKSRYISMIKLCEVYGDEELLKYRNLIKSKTRHSSSSGANSSSRLKDVNYWRMRPLTRPMIIESTMDVYCLIGGIYQNLKSKLRPEYEPLFEQLNLEGVLARIKPDEIKSAKKGRKIDLEVIDLKRKLYRDATGPVVLSNREIRLLRHIDLTEEVRQKIQQCKKVAKKLERLDTAAQQLQANQLQSLNSQNSDQNGLGNRENDPQSLISSSSTGETSLSTTTTSTCSNEQQLVEDEERILSSFMDSSSMFDELKDKMIESSNLLDSIEDSLRTPI